ncbi:MAG: sel1 repeat family protein [Magnetospirillum sp.]|nr:sel1 repeat family protein [Magnetospirillum sp.]
MMFGIVKFPAGCALNASAPTTRWSPVTAAMRGALWALCGLCCVLGASACSGPTPSGSAEAMVNLAQALRSANSLDERVYRQRADLLLKAAEQGHTGAMIALFDALSAGAGMPRDPAQALEWLQRAAEAGDTSAEARLGRFHLEHRADNEELELAGEWLFRAARRGDQGAVFDLLCALRLSNERGASAEVAAMGERLLEALRQGAAQRGADGYAYGNDLLTRIYRCPVGSDPLTLWRQEWAGRGHADAHYDLGWSYAVGRGNPFVSTDIPQDRGLAVRHMLAAAEGGNAYAQIELARWLLVGRYLAHDDTRAVRWLERAADRVPRAAAMVGALMRDGRGGAADAEGSERWFVIAERSALAAAQGEAFPERSVGSVVATGEDGLGDDQRASQWYRRAVAKGDPGSAHALWALNRAGRIAAADDEIMLWLRLAGLGGFQDARSAYCQVVTGKDDDAQAWCRR